jgi:hypothetical protein
MNIKDLQNNEDLMNNLVDDIDEIPEDSEVSYEVWAIGYDADKNITDAEMLISEFNNPDEAVEKAKTISLADIIHQAAEEHDGSEPTDEVAYISIEVETTVANEADDEIFNIGTIYQRELWIDGEYGSEENIEDLGLEEDEDYPEDQIVYLEDGTYEVLEDNTLKVNCSALKGFNKNDIVMFYFPKEEFPMEYKIMSKVMYEDSDYYHCELTY